MPAGCSGLKKNEDAIIIYASNLYRFSSDPY